jgi:hypothetical protein
MDAAMFHGIFGLHWAAPFGAFDTARRYEQRSGRLSREPLLR